MTEQMTNQPKAQLVPVVYADGGYAMITLPEDSRWSGRPYVQLYQVVGEPHDRCRSVMEIERLVLRGLDLQPRR